MGWLQVKRWLSFLPAAFVVYILLHYLVYQPDLTGPQPPVLVTGGRGSNGSIVSDVAGPRTLQEARVLPHLLPDGDTSDAATHLPTSLDAAVAAAAPVAIEVGNGQPPSEDNSTLHQGGAAHTSVRVSSTVQSISASSSSSSSSSGGAADAGGGKASISSAAAPAAQNKSPPGNLVVVQGTGLAPQPKQTVTKKTTVVKKSNVASSSSLSINALKGRTKVGEKYESGFSVPHEELCINNGRDLKVLVLITTAPDHEKHRTAVRQTWGHFSVRKDVVMAFVIGRTTNVNIQNNIDKENEIYGDIIQANFIDHYANLTLKTISMFEWVKTYCSESHFVLKTDDDMFINMPLLLTFIDSKKNDHRVMYGRLAKGWKPVRNKKSKYYIDTATYSKTKYPDFLTGPAYLFTNDIVDDIYQKALGTTFFVLEDVLVTGIVGESLRIRRVGDSRFRNEKIKLTDTCSLMKTVSIHMVKYEEQFDIYKRTLDGKAKCKVG